ncbi:uncharacterized protein OCT59_009468 [Rhizophagus irregularis]|uniref:uncharacterized protein n=1 Tax=Rhizophagus irregularis TaxID=588596 RepID=UPI00331CC743|nr:hypothetical protein OCT59_009468 [Rhizophagus irregularis]
MITSSHHQRVYLNRLANLSKTVIRRYSNNNNVTSKAHEFLTSDELKTFRNGAGLVTFGGAAVLGNWKLVNSSIDRSLVPINSKLDHIGNQNIELIKETVINKVDKLIMYTRCEHTSNYFLQIWKN